MFSRNSTVVQVIIILMLVQVEIAFSYKPTEVPDNFVQILDLRDIPGPYRFNNMCLKGKGDLWTGTGDGEVHYENIVTGRNVVYKLENKSLFNGDFYGIFFNENGNGWVVGDNGVIFHTPDNGNSWQLQESNIRKNIDLQAVTCIDENCWVAGEYGTLLSSNNKGIKWKKIDIKADEEDLEDVFFIKNKIGWVLGGEGGIWKTVDGGKTWSFQELKIDGEYAHSLSIKFHDEQKGWISGFDFVARTEDGGKTWQVSELDGQIIGIVTQDGEKVWAIKRGGNYCSTDSGKVWSMCNPEKAEH